MCESTQILADEEGAGLILGSLAGILHITNKKKGQSASLDSRKKNSKKKEE
jgi:hypothetical protein